MKQKEIVLAGGTSTQRVVRIEDRVHRTQCANSGYVHLLLQHLETENFSFAPRFLGVDASGQEMLTFIHGEVPRDTPLTFAQKIDSIKILRTFHDATVTGSLRKNSEVVCHNDFAPWNIIVSNFGQINGIIDFDEAAPGKRIDDVTYFIWTALDLGVTNQAVADQIEAILKLMNTYNLTDKREFTSSLLVQQHRILSKRKDMVLNHRDHDVRAFSEGAVVRIEQSIKWVEDNEEDIEAALV